MKTWRNLKSFILTLSLCADSIQNLFEFSEAEILNFIVQKYAKANKTTEFYHVSFNCQAQN